MTDEKPPGRLLGGLFRFRDSRVGAWTRSETANRIFWHVAGGVTGSVIGLLLVTVYLRLR